MCQAQTNSRLIRGYRSRIFHGPLLTSSLNMKVFKEIGAQIEVAEPGTRRSTEGTPGFEHHVARESVSLESLDLWISVSDITRRDLFSLDHST